MLVAASAKSEAVTATERQFEPERVEDQPSFGLRATLRDGARMWHYFSSLFYGRFWEHKIAPIVFS
jgi:hypothetical protein